MRSPFAVLSLLLAFALPSEAQYAARYPQPVAPAYAPVYPVAPLYVTLMQAPVVAAPSPEVAELRAALARLEAEVALTRLAVANLGKPDLAAQAKLAELTAQGAAKDAKVAALEQELASIKADNVALTTRVDAATDAVKQMRAPQPSAQQPTALPATTPPTHPVIRGLPPKTTP